MRLQRRLVFRMMLELIAKYDAAVAYLDKALDPLIVRVTQDLTPELVERCVPRTASIWPYRTESQDKSHDTDLMIYRLVPELVERCAPRTA